MANFFVTPEGDFTAINIDQIHMVQRDEGAKDTLVIYFHPDHTIKLQGRNAAEFMDVFMKIDSEARRMQRAKKNPPEETGVSNPRRTSHNRRPTAWG